MNKLRWALAISISANISMVLMLALYKAVAKDALLETKEYERYMIKMADMLTDEQNEELAKYADMNITFRNIMKDL